MAEPPPHVKTPQRWVVVVVVAVVVAVVMVVVLGRSRIGGGIGIS